MADTNDFLPRLWATRKIGYLLDAIRLRQTDATSSPDDPELVAEIVRLSKEYGVVTPYTSFLVTDGSEEPPPLNGPVLHGVFRGRASASAPSGGGYPGGGGFGGGGFGGGRGGFGGAPGITLAAPPTQAYAAVSGPVATTQSQALRATKSASVANGLAGYDEAQAKAVGDHVRTVGTKTFIRQGGVWTDSAYDAAKQKDLTVVQAFSDAQFALLKAIPGLAAYTSLGDNVLVVLDSGKALKISAKEGVKTLDAAALGRLK